jgi:hypothetical protein
MKYTYMHTYQGGPGQYETFPCHKRQYHPPNVCSCVCVRERLMMKVIVLATNYNALSRYLLVCILRPLSVSSNLPTSLRRTSSKISAIAT